MFVLYSFSVKSIFYDKMAFYFHVEDWTEKIRVWDCNQKMEIRSEIKFVKLHNNLPCNNNFLIIYIE